MKKLIAVATLTALAAALAACKRDSPAADPAPATSATASATRGATSTAPTLDPSAPATPEDPAAPLDKGAFSGIFANGQTRLELHADGTYLLDAKDESGRGTWTYDATARTIRLDPGTKGAEDRVIHVDGRDQLAPIAAPGQAVMPRLSRLAES